MSNMFGNASSELAGSEKEKDVLGGRSLLPTGVYDGSIEVVYITTSEKGAKAFNLVLNIKGKIVRETIYVTNREGGVTYTKDGKKYPLPGYSLMNALTKLTVGKEIPNLAFEKKLVKIYNFELKKEVPVEVDVAVELIGENVSVGIEHVKENKQAKDQTGLYVSTPEIRESNTITRVFHPKTGQTAAEYDTQAPAEFKVLWLREFEGKVRDRTNKALPTTAEATAAIKGKTSLFGS